MLQPPTKTPRSAISSRRWPYRSFARASASTKHPDTELVFRFPRRGLSNLEAQPYGFFHSLSDYEMLHMVMQAERDGFDAVIIACYDDPTL